MAELYVSWADYHRKIEQLALLIYRANWSFNQIVCIAKGGLRIGDILCRLYDVPLAILSAASYGGTDNRVREEITFGSHLAMTTPKLGDRVLLVDDLVDSGISIRDSLRWLEAHHGEEISEIRTAVLWYKHCSQVKPDFYVDYLPDDPWIHQPFEYYEQHTPAELAQRLLGEEPTPATSQH